MTEQSLYVIGLRVNPETEVADWFTLWYEDASGGNRVLARNGRAIWAQTVSGARALAPLSLGGPSANGSDVDDTCDVAGSLYAIARGESGGEAVVLSCLNHLDDVLNTIGSSPSLPGGSILDRLVVRLTDGEPLPAAVAALGGKEEVVNPILASLGRLFNWSTFICR